MKNDSDKIKFNLEYWTLHYLINKYPEVYLSEAGLLIYKIVEHSSKDKMKTCSKISKELETSYFKLTNACKKTEEIGHIFRVKKGTRKVMMLNPEITRKCKKEFDMVMLK